MSAANFRTMRDFPLFIKDYDEEVKTCPECGCTMEASAQSCDECGCTSLEDEIIYDALACEMDYEDITDEMEELNRNLLFHQVSLKSGYYLGVQFNVDTEHDVDDYDNEDCHYYFDCCRSVARRKYLAEKRKINRFLVDLAQRYGFIEMVPIAHFSNGEVWYGRADDPRNQMKAIVA